jgi:hypothetical protein
MSRCTKYSTEDFKDKIKLWTIELYNSKKRLLNFNNLILVEYKNLIDDLIEEIKRIEEENEEPIHDLEHMEKHNDYLVNDKK